MVSIQMVSILNYKDCDIANKRWMRENGKGLNSHKIKNQQIGIKFINQ